MGFRVEWEPLECHRGPARASGSCIFSQRAGILFYDPATPAGAAVAKPGNGARFRVSSLRGPQVQILAAAILSECVEEGDLLEDEVSLAFDRDCRGVIL